MSISHSFSPVPPTSLEAIIVEAIKAIEEGDITKIESLLEEITVTHEQPLFSYLDLFESALEKLKQQANQDRHVYEVMKELVCPYLVCPYTVVFKSNAAPLVQGEIQIISHDNNAIECRFLTSDGIEKWNNISYSQLVDQSDETKAVTETLQLRGAVKNRDLYTLRFFTANLLTLLVEKDDIDFELRRKQLVKARLADVITIINDKQAAQKKMIFYLASRCFLQNSQLFFFKGLFFLIPFYILVIAFPVPALIFSITKAALFSSFTVIAFGGLFAECLRVNEYNLKNSHPDWDISAATVPNMLIPLHFSIKYYITVYLVPRLAMPWRAGILHQLIGARSPAPTADIKDVLIFLRREEAELNRQISETSEKKIVQKLFADPVYSSTTSLKWEATKCLAEKITEDQFRSFPWEMQFYLFKAQHYIERPGRPLAQPVSPQEIKQFELVLSLPAEQRGASQYRWEIAKRLAFTLTKESYKKLSPLAQHSIFAAKYKVNELSGQTPDLLPFPRSQRQLTT